MRKFEAAIFDMDRTLFDTERLLLSFWEQGVKKYGEGWNIK